MTNLSSYLLFDSEFSIGTMYDRYVCHPLAIGWQEYIFFISKHIKKHFMKPINDRVVVKPAPADEKTSGGIIIPDTAKEKPQRGEVVAVGPGKEGNKMTVKKGDVVLYGKYSGQEITHEGKDFLIMREDDILVIL